MSQLPKLSKAEISAMVYKQRKPKAKAKSYMTRDSNGMLISVAGKPKAAEKGSWEGKVGTVRRSRKGMTTRMPNGSRRYNPGYDEAVMY